MSSATALKIPASAQPKPADYRYDLEQALAAVVGLRAVVPQDAFTAETLGTERAGNAISIGNGLLLTVGYLITEAESVWLHLHNGRIVAGHAAGFDGETGFGLVQMLERVEIPSLSMGNSDALAVSEKIVLAGAGGRTHSVAGRVAARQEFAGYWEYLLDDAIFTAPAHPNWGGTALINAQGELVGVGSLQLERERAGRNEPLNMAIPINLAKPVIDDLRKFGRVNRPVRPWLGIYSTEVDDKVVVVGIAPKGPADRAEVRTGDVLAAVAGEKVSTLAELYRRLWALGPAGVEVPLTIYRDGVTFDVAVNSSDRSKFLRTPRLH
jgi:S1-C subfamily serine protease